MHSWRRPRRLSPFALLIGVALVMIACSQGNATHENRAQSGSKAGPEHRQGSRMMVTPPALLRSCRGVKGARHLCPTKLPRAQGYALSRIARSASGEYITVQFAAGRPQADYEDNAPPTYVHVVLEAGDLRDAFETFHHPSSGRVFHEWSDALVGKRRRELAHKRIPEALFLGRVNWAGRRGTLVLVPSFDDVSSIHADHVLFRRQSGGFSHAVSLHSWEPFRQTVETLRKIVESMPSD